MSKEKKTLIIVGLCLDAAITLFFFILSLVLIVKQSIHGPALRNTGGLIGYLANNPTVYLCAFVLPTFLLLAANIVGLVFYLKRTGAKKAQVSVNDLSDEQKEQLRQELLKDLNK